MIWNRFQVDKPEKVAHLVATKVLNYMPPDNAANRGR